MQLKKIDMPSGLSFLLILLCLASALMAIKFELALNTKLFTLFAGLFMVFFGFLLSLIVKIKWSDYALRHRK